MNGEYDEEIEEGLLELWSGDDDPREYDGETLSIWHDDDSDVAEFLRGAI